MSARVRRPWLALSSSFALVAVVIAATGPAAAPAGGPEVYFSPRGGVEAAVVREIERARRSVLVLAYGFSNAAIARAVVEAHRRGVTVEIILDGSNETQRYSAATFLLHAGVTPLIDKRHAIFHNKVVVIDESTVLTGSFNFTRAAEESNAENLIILRDPSLAARYLENAGVHRAHAHPYTGPITRPDRAHRGAAVR